LPTGSKTGNLGEDNPRNRRTQRPGENKAQHGKKRRPLLLPPKEKRHRTPNGKRGGNFPRIHGPKGSGEGRKKKPSPRENNPAPGKTLGAPTNRGLDGSPPGGSQKAP